MLSNTGSVLEFKYFVDYQKLRSKMIGNISYYGLHFDVKKTFLMNNIHSKKKIDLVFKAFKIF